MAARYLMPHQYHLPFYFSWGQTYGLQKLWQGITYLEFGAFFGSIFQSYSQFEFGPDSLLATCPRSPLFLQWLGLCPTFPLLCLQSMLLFTLLSPGVNHSPCTSRLASRNGGPPGNTEHTLQLRIMSFGFCLLSHVMPLLPAWQYSRAALGD